MMREANSTSHDPEALEMAPVDTGANAAPDIINANGSPSFAAAENAITFSPTADSPPTRPSLSSPVSPQTFLLPPPRRRLQSVSRGSIFSQRSQRFTITLWKPRTLHRWGSPASMVFFFVVGFCLSLGHCVRYAGLNNQIVGDSYQQEENLRIGTALAFLAQLAHTASVWKAYTQWLWKAVYSKSWTANGLNKAFSADTSPSSLLNQELYKNFTLGAVIAFFAWCLLLPPFFTPAALVVYNSTQELTTLERVPYLAIANSSAGGEFAYSPPSNSSTIKFVDDTTRIFTGPRTVLTLLAGATASQGEILSIRAPSNHSAYSIDFYGPIVQCQDANETTIPLINDLLQAQMAVPKRTARQKDSAYFGFVPAINSTGDLVALSQPRYQEPSNATNELWMTFQRYAFNSTGQRTRNRMWQVCRLHNATYDLHLEWDRGVQNVSGRYKVHEEIGFPHDSSGTVSNMAQHAYASFMWTLTDQLVGSMGWYQEQGSEDDAESDSLAQFGAIESPIRQTSLLGSVDLDVYFDFNSIYHLYAFDNETAMSAQRLQDKAFARNRTLARLIEELSFNMTVSLLHNELLTYNTTKKVTRWNDVNRYRCIFTSLLIPYGLANLVVFSAVVVGMASFIHHGTFPDKTFQDIANAAADPRIVKIIRSSDDDENQTSEIPLGRTRPSNSAANSPLMENAAAEESPV